MSNISDRILYEDNHLIVVNKLPSEIVQGDKTGDVCLLDDVKEYIKVKDRDFRKVYLALVKNHPPKQADVLEDYIVKNEKMNKSFVVPEGTKEAKLARLSYRVIGKSDTFYLLEIELFTGRHHQIRCQLAHIGCPIRGDLKYGYPRSNPDASISLHAYRIAFEHPVLKTQIEVTAPLPNISPWTAFDQLSVES